MQAATDSRRTAALVFYAFDLLYLDGENLTREALLEPKCESGRCHTNTRNPTAP
jgi:hypothetical protein